MLYNFKCRLAPRRYLKRERERRPPFPNDARNASLAVWGGEKGRGLSCVPPFPSLSELSYMLSQLGPVAPLLFQMTSHPVCPPSLLPLV
ncbi:hypothetical protein CDAR_61581 [Caerostris darwini]|uniref:Uncharacterized protein n=1 Tax=Caerostris darwini TaxID=1538125 RepID=A0AAV4R056_9ARAC|nr:hypothetical protein CDAR_61581 [Caerostris darwini]